MSKICIILLMQLAINGAITAAVTEKINETLIETVTDKTKSTLSEAVTLTVTSEIIDTTASTDKLEDDATTIVPSEKCDGIKCPSVPKHYEEMGCEAVKNEGDCCASR